MAESEGRSNERDSLSLGGIWDASVECARAMVSVRWVEAMRPPLVKAPSLLAGRLPSRWEGVPGARLLRETSELQEPQAPSAAEAVPGGVE